MGTDIAAHSRVVDVKQGVVIVEVDHPGWLQVLQMKKAKILTEMKKRYPALGIENMRIFVADTGRDDNCRAEKSDADSAGPADGGVDREQVENSVEYQRFKEMLERLRKTRRS